MVNRASVEASFTVEVVDDIRAALKNWGAATRSSPIFAVDESAVPPLEGKRETHLCFLGPIRPEELPDEVQRFLSFGLYNAVLFAQSSKERDALAKFIASKARLPWELWTLRGAKVIGIKCSPAFNADAPRVNVKALNLPGKLRSATDEYQTLVAVTKSRSQFYIPEVAKELTVFEEDFEGQLSTLDLHLIRKLQLLVNVNAALSRFSSQTFAGTSPILATECHFWTHSLLGIGMASKALLNIRRQVERSAIEAAFIERIQALKSLAATPVKLGNLKATDEWWITAQLPPPPAGHKSASARIPLVVYYSGRDGFKSTTFTLSAPLEVLHGANTYAWSLQTTTHELSHIFVERIVSTVLEDDIESAIWLRKASEVHNGQRVPSNLFERVQELFIESCVRLEWEDKGPEAGSEIEIEGSELPGIVARHYQGISELLAHLFDYIYFYDQNRKSYIRSIWSSWDVIPNIKSRVEGYVIRSLFALHFGNLSVKDGIAITFNQLRDELASLKADIKDDQYIGHALELLRTKEAGFKKKLNERTQLVKFAKTALFSADAVKAFATKPPASKRGRQRSEATKQRAFEKNRAVQNPLAFIAGASKHEEPNAASSLWLLTQLALAEGLDDA